MIKSLIHKKIITLTLVLSFVAPVGLMTIPNKARALDADWIGGPSNVINVGFSAISASSDVISATAQSSLAFKEYVLDPLTILLKEVLIKSITASIVNWINGGFEGEPAFITDLEGFLLDVGDQVIGTYIEGSELAFLCSPFQIDVRIALALDYYTSTRDRASCTLTGAIKNVEDAFGDFSSGNAWDSWFEFSMNPNNNAFGSFLGARQSLYKDIASAQSRKLRILDWGRGVQSYEVCDTEGVQDPNNSANISVGKFNCRIATPGAVIYEQLNEVLPTGLKQLELADEFNEIIGALLGQLVKQVLGGSQGGFSGLSRSSNGNLSYTNRLLQENSDTSSINARALDAIRTNIEEEGEYRDAKQTSLNAVRVAREKVETLHQCYLEKASQNQTLWGVIGEEDNREIVSFTTVELISNASSASSTVTSTLLPLQNKLTEDIGKVDTTIGQLISIRTDIENVRSVEDLNSAVSKYQTLQKSGQLKTAKDVYDAELERDGYIGDLHGLAKGIIRDMATLNKQTEADLEICQSLIFTYEPSTI